MKKHLFLFFMALMALGFMSCEKGSNEGGLNAPTGFKVSQSGSSLILEWQAVSGAESYSLTKNDQFWQTTSATRVVDENPVMGVNTYTLVASDGARVSSKVSVSYNFKGSGQGGEDPQQATYYIKHPWNGGTWEWKKMEYEGEGQYSYRDCYWGGTGANINTSATDEDAQWFPAAQIDGAAQAKEGDKGTFVYVAASKMLMFVVEDPGENPQTASFYIKHPWGGSSEWTWQPMVQNGNAYTYTGVWGGTGANINTSASDSGSEWYPASSISGASSLTNGTTVTFSFVSTNGPVGSLSVSSNGGGGGGTTTVPSTPDGLTATAGSSSISLRWNSVSGATSYNVYRATSAGGNYTKLDNVGNTSYTDYDVSAGSTYYYKVTSQNGAGESARSSAVSATISSGGGGDTSTKPNAPTELTATVSGSVAVPSVDLSWNGVSDADYYYVYRSASASGSYEKINKSYTTSSYDNSPKNGKNYYRVTAVNSAGKESDKSDYAYVTIDKNAVSPCPPSVSCSGTSTITVSWSAASSSGCGKPTSYTVRRKNWLTGQAETLKEGTTSTSYKDSQPYPGKNLYGVIATNEYGSSNAGTAYSSEVTIAAPTVVQVYASWSGLDVVVKDIDVPDEWKPYYILRLYRSSSSSGTFLPEKDWKYEDAYSTDDAKHTRLYELNYGTSIHGTTLYYKVCWVFNTNYVPSEVVGKLSSAYAGAH